MFETIKYWLIGGVGALVFLAGIGMKIREMWAARSVTAKPTTRTQSKDRKVVLQNLTDATDYAIWEGNAEAANHLVDAYAAFMKSELRKGKE